MNVTACECCGHPVVADEIERVLTPMQARIFKAVKRAGAAGVSSKDIMGIVYADDPNGGPENTNIIAVVANQANKRLAPLGLKITASRGPWARLRLVEVAA
jgi:hypothetical protein